MLQAMRSSAKYIWIVAIAIPFIVIFLFGQTSGLLGRAPATPTTAIGKVNGQEISVAEWQRVMSNRQQEAVQRLGHPLTLDEEQALEQQVFDEMVQNILLDQELSKRHIGVTDAEILDAARNSPPPELINAPQLQTDGKFDQQKYLRFLTSPLAKEQGFLNGLEAVYRQEIPREKLYEQLSAGVYVTDQQLWNLWRDTHDTAQISFVRLAPDSASEAGIQVSDADLQKYYDGHHAELTRKGQATVSLVMIPRIITHADSAAALAHIEALKKQIDGGAKFEDVAKQESSDSASAVQGGSLGWGKKGRFVSQFETAAWALRPGEISQPVLSPFGYHLIRMDAHQGDSAKFSHILIRIQQSDSTAVRMNAHADSLERAGAGAENPAQFDRAAKQAGLTPARVHVTEGTPVFWNGHQVPSVATWAFSGAKVGESSDLFEADDGFYLARLDSVTPGGLPPLADVKDEVRRLVLQDRALDKLVVTGRQLADRAASSSLADAAKTANLPVVTSPPFTPTSYVPDVGRMNQAVGAAFRIPVGSISDPIKTSSAVFVLKVDRRVPADSATWDKQKGTQRQNVLRDLRRQRIEEFLADLREVAKVTDNRKEIEAANKRAQT